MFDLVYLLSISAAGMEKKKFFLIIKKKMKNKKCHATCFAYLLMKWKNSQPFQLDSYEEQ